MELSSEDNARDIEFAPPPPQEAVREAVRIQPAQPGEPQVRQQCQEVKQLCRRVYMSRAFTQINARIS